MATVVDDNVGEPGVTPDEYITVPATPFAGPYLSAFFRNLIGSDGDPGVVRPEDLLRFTHLNCSFFNVARSGQAPTLLQLKQHAQALFSLIALVDVLDSEVGADPFDFLDHLETPYQNEHPAHHAPLTDVANLLDHYSGTGGAGGAGPDAAEQAPCPLSQKPVRHIAFYLEHVNALLTKIDQAYRSVGGLLALVPGPERPAQQAAARATLLGQWLEYTVGLVQRLYALQAEVEQLRELAKGEAFTPYQVERKGLLAAGKPLLFPQDRYVLAHLSSDLWHVLDVKLKADERARARQRTRAGPEIIPVTLREMHDRRLGLDPDRAAGGLPSGLPDTAGSITASIKVPSRLFRVRGLPTIFVVPAVNAQPTRKSDIDIDGDAPDPDELDHHDEPPHHRRLSRDHEHDHDVDIDVDVHSDPDSLSGDDPTAASIARAIGPMPDFLAHLHAEGAARAARRRRRHAGRHRVDENVVRANELTTELGRMHRLRDADQRRMQALERDLVALRACVPVPVPVLGPADDVADDEGEDDRTRPTPMDIDPPEMPMPDPVPTPAPAVTPAPVPAPVPAPAPALTGRVTRNRARQMAKDAAGPKG
ncbi:MAG: hypothetical protein M1826_007699 [Phylliscum demangeonii]|nr:MAG: hypothetical protein M1826_007699 [Phylliscum demangeonii]